MTHSLVHGKCVLDLEWVGYSHIGGPRSSPKLKLEKTRVVCSVNKTVEIIEFFLGRIFDVLK